MTRTQTVGWVEPAKSNERSIGRHAGKLLPPRRCTLNFDATRSNHSLPSINVGWMTLHPSTNARQPLILNPNQRWKTLRGFPPYGFPTVRRSLP